MGYIDWGNVLGEINLDFLNPLLDEISKVYDDQWKDAKERLITSDPYGSSIREREIADAAGKYSGEAAREKSGIISDYYQALLNNKFKNEAEDLQGKYDELQEEYDDYKDEQQKAPVKTLGIFDSALTRSDMRRLWQTNPEQHPFWSMYNKPENTAQPVQTNTSSGSGSSQNNGSSVFSIVNPGFLNTGIFGGIGMGGGGSAGVSSGGWGGTGGSGSGGSSSGGGSGGGSLWGGALPDSFDDYYIENVGGNSGLWNGGGDSYSGGSIGFGTDFDVRSRSRSGVKNSSIGSGIGSSGTSLYKEKRSRRVF